MSVTVWLMSAMNGMFTGVSITCMGRCLQIERRLRAQRALDQANEHDAEVVAWLHSLKDEGDK